MDGSIFRDLYRGLVIIWICAGVVIAGAFFGLGYGCHACNYRPHFEMRKIEK